MPVLQVAQAAFTATFGSGEAFEQIADCTLRAFGEVLREIGRGIVSNQCRLQGAGNDTARANRPRRRWLACRRLGSRIGCHEIRRPRQTREGDALHAIPAIVKTRLAQPVGVAVNVLRLLYHLSSLSHAFELASLAAWSSLPTTTTIFPSLSISTRLTCCPAAVTARIARVTSCWRNVHGTRAITASITSYTLGSGFHRLPDQTHSRSQFYPRLALFPDPGDGKEFVDFVQPRLPRSGIIGIGA